ncbi:unnamed protein product [Aphanomyces euteiches]
MNASIDLSATPMTHALLVDCDYSGRHFQDTTMFKIYLVDTSMTSMMSIAIQTMIGLRETTHLATQVGATVVSLTQLSKFGLGPDEPPGAEWFYGLTYDDATAFHETYHDGVSASNEYKWRIQSTNESLLIAGLSGYYRGSTASQTNMLRFLIDMTGSPVRDFVVDMYPSLAYWKDAWAWVQGLVILTIGVRVGFTIVVALSIAFTTSKSTAAAHLPDVFPTIKRHIHVRSFLLVLAFVCDGFWSIHEWALTVGFIRYNLLPLFVLGENIRSDLLMLFLVWTDGVASALRVGIWPAITVVAYILCYTHSSAIVAALSSQQVEDATAEYFNQAYIANTIAYASFGMNEWNQYVLPPEEPPLWLVAREFVWFIAPCIGIAGLLVVYKLALVAMAKLGGERYRVHTADDAENFKVSVAEMAAMRGVPSVFLDNFIPERHGIPTKGLLTLPPPRFLFSKDAFQMPKTLLWSSGWLILDHKFVVYADDLPRIVASVLTGISFGQAYCCSIRTLDSRRTLVPQLMPVPVAELSWRSLLHVSVEALWVKKLAHDDQDVRDFAAKTQQLRSSHSQLKGQLQPRKPMGNPPTRGTTLLDRHDDDGCLLGVPDTIQE